MKHAFKPLGIAAAVAAASASYVNVANAQDPVVANNALGDLALVPYYTVNGEWITGIHIVNTSDSTQVVKFRFRRAEDSMDALDFNIVMSPFDVYAGFLSDDENGNINWSADDTTCTVPATSNGVLTMPAIFREGAETGYVEIIAMGETIDEDQTIAIAAEHDDGVPEDCDVVRQNFFANGTTLGTNGVVSNAQTTSRDAFDVQDNDDSTSDAAQNFYTDSGNVLKVSYFIRDNATGVEFGDNAVHIQDFLNNASITNQQFGFIAGDLDGFDFPDLDGGVPTATIADPGSMVPERNRFNALRSPSVLGVGTLLNEWTANPANGAALDWVVTLPGQYTMLDLPIYYLSLLDAADGEDPDDIQCVRVGGDGGFIATPEIPTNPRLVCDYRDIPVSASITPYNREEGTLTAAEGELVVSPSPPGATPTLTLPNETNVITFGGNSVLGVSDVDISADLGQPFGWLTLGITGQSNARVCQWNPLLDADGSAIGVQTATVYAGLHGLDDGTGPDPDTIGQCINDATGVPPMIGFAAWQRSVAANPDASYGRIVAHSFTS